MISLVRGGCGLPWKTLTLALGIGIISGSSAVVRAGGVGGMGDGTLGYAPPGRYPGFSGFGLGFHPGYGYGGSGLGVGAYGGYPFYGGPGYPHCEPRLRRFGRLNPFPYYGGPGYPRYGYSNYFNDIGPLVLDPPVAGINDDRGFGYASGYGPFTGALPYPETTFAPYVAAAAATGSSREVSSLVPAMPSTGTAPGVGFGSPSVAVTPGAGSFTNSPVLARALGIDEEPMVDADGTREIRVSRIYPGTAAERAGLQVGDVIHSINGYLTQQPGNLAWIIANAAPDNVLKIQVRKVSDGKEQTITVQFP